MTEKEARDLSNLLIRTDPEIGPYGTGHLSILEIQKTDQEIEITMMEGMKVKCIEEGNDLDLVFGKIYDVISIEEKFYRIIDESEEDYLYPPEMFEIIKKGKIVK